MIYLLVPVYNEVENLEKLSRSLLSLPDSATYFFVFVDDCSTDNSVHLIKELFDSVQYQIITKDENRGPGHSFDLGFNWIIERCSDDDVVVTLEADGTSDLAIFPVMVDLAKNYEFDLVLASVYAQGGGFEKTSFFRMMISFWANLLLRALFNVKVLTLSSFYRVYKASILKAIRSKYGTILDESGFACMFEMVIKSIELDAKIIEVPMLLRSEERVGKSKMKIFRTSKEYIRLILSRSIFK